MVELLVVMLLMGIVGSIVMTSLVGGMRTTMRGQERAIALAELQRGADRMGRELRAGTPVTLATHSVTLDVFRSGQRQRYTFTVTSEGVLQETRLTWNNRNADPAVTPADASYTRPVMAQLRYDAAVPVFRFFPGSGPEIVAPTAPYASVDQIEVSLPRVVSDNDILRLDTAVDLRNSNFLGAS